MNTVKFNLKKALANPELVVYRNKEKPKEWHWLKTADQKSYCIVSIYTHGEMLTHTKRGFDCAYLGNSEYDLLLISPKRKPAKKK